MAYHVRIKEIRPITHDVKQFDFERPDGYEFEPGQATEVSINKDGWRNANHPFTFTALPDAPFLQFTIKIYPDHHGLTEQIGLLEPGDEFIIHDVWGTIQYEGPGVFLAGGAGITPFIAILRDLARKGKIAQNKLIYSNKTSRDVILQDELRAMLGQNFVSALTDKAAEGHHFLDGFIDKDFLSAQIQDFAQPIYVCGPPPFNEAMMNHLKELGARPEGLICEK